MKQKPHRENEFIPAKTIKERNKQLCNAAKTRNLAETEKLLKTKIQVDTKETGTGKTPFMLACHYKFPKIIKALAEAGADVNKKDKQNIG